MAEYQTPQKLPFAAVAVIFVVVAGLSQDWGNGAHFAAA